MNLSAPDRNQYIRNVVLDLILTILFCGLWNMVVQYYQCKALNVILKREKYIFWKFSLFSLLTCGIYYIFHEYQKAEDFRLARGEESSDPILALFLSFFGLGWIYDAVLQGKLNQHFEKENLGI